MGAELSYAAAAQGAAVMESHKEALTQLIRKSRRFFPEGSAAEIWAEFRGGLQDTHQPAAFESLGWLVLLMPTLAAGRGEGDWDAWLPLWLDTWAKVMYSGYWDCLWMALLARLIKHDTTGIVRWHLHLDAIYTRIVSYFQVPVGTSSASIPIHRCSSPSPLSPAPPAPPCPPWRPTEASLARHRAGPSYSVVLCGSRGLGR